MADENKHDKTEAPTHRRLEDARKRGNVPRSRDLASAVALLASASLLTLAGQSLGAWVLQLTRSLLSGSAQVELDSAVVAGRMLAPIGSGLLSHLLPIAMAAMLASLLTGLLQTGFVVSVEPIQPNWSRFHPKNGLQKLLPGKQSLRTAAKNLTATAVLFAVGYVTLSAALPGIFELCQRDPRHPLGILAVLTQTLVSLLLRLSGVLVVMGVVDYVLARRRFRDELKMSKAEVRQEMKEMDGNPQVKGRRRQMARRYSMARMMADVPKADAIVTNPTHYAVAIRYRRDVGPAPVVLAKGSDEMAQKIKAIARHHGIVMVENRPLARTLFATAQVGKPVPVELYRGVAEVLAYVYRLNGARGRKVGP
jgi:flagellar biosynthesis protein FlhB